MEPSSELKYGLAVILEVWSLTCIIGPRLVAACILLGTPIPSFS